MKKISLLAIILTIPLWAGLAFSGSVKVIRISEDDFSFLHESDIKGLDILAGIPGVGIDVAIDEKELIDLEAKGVFPTVLCPDLEAVQMANSWAYHSWNDAIGFIEDIADTYPQITSLEIIGQSVNGREIQALKISDNPIEDEQDEVDVLFISLHHAREWPALEMGLYIADILTSQYDSNPEIRNIVDNEEIYVIPCMNPDGYVYSHDQGHDWRKNRRYFPEFGSYGVDLNRNWGGSCDGNPDGQWGSVIGSVSHGADTEVYCGPGPFSENENIAVRNFMSEHDFDISITYHTYSELILYPWGYTYNDAPDNNWLYSYASGMGSRISGQYGGTYTPIQSSSLYPTAGDMTDWAYGHTLYTEGHSSASFTVEMCASFAPPSYQLQDILDENWDGALYMLQQADNIHNTLSYRVLPPVIDPLGSDPDGSYRISWTVPNPESNPTKYKLEELSELQWVSDGAESANGLWTFTGGFTRSTGKSHSGNYSYFSNLHSNNKVTAMTLVYPWPVTSGDYLEFWTYYDIETNWDYAMVEISVDGNNWDLLESFTGSSGWNKKSYSLDEYAGSSIFVRFRYITDDYTLKTGIYIDDITMVPSYGNVTVLSSDIIDTYYDVSGRSPGKYYYRVTGYNSDKGWGDPGMLEDITVTGNYDIEVEIIPDSYSVSRGEDFSYTLRVTNLSPDPVYIDAWTELYLPGGSAYPGNPFVGPTSGSIPGYGEVLRNFSSPVPFNAPVGTYTYTFIAGSYPDISYAENSVNIEID